MATSWRKSPEWLVAAFPALLPDDPRVEPRKMFGYPCAFANGNMFIGLHQENLILRLPEPERDRFLAEHDSHIFAPFPDRPMREYVVVPHALIKKPAALAPWIAESLDYAASLPRKAKRDKRAQRAPEQRAKGGTAKGSTKTARAKGPGKAKPAKAARAAPAKKRPKAAQSARGAPATKRAKPSRRPARKRR